MYGYRSSYPEDIKINKKVAKFEEEFSKYSPLKQLWQDDEQNEENPWMKEIPLKESVYGRKKELFQQNPIGLEESPASMKDIFKTDAGSKKEE